MTITIKEIIQRARDFYNKAPRPARTPEDQEKYRNISAKRRIKSFFDLPKLEQELLGNFIKKHGIKTVTLGGSWAAGTWATKETDLDFIALRKLVTGKSHFSDVDIVIEPAKYIDDNTGVQAYPSLLNVHLFVIYKDGKFI